MGDDSESVARGVAQFIREVVEGNQELRSQLLERLGDMLNFVQSSVVCETMLWTLGEYPDTRAEVKGALSAIKSSLGSPPLHGSYKGSTSVEDDFADDASDGAASSVATATTSVRPVVLADGTYASQSAVAEEKEGGMGFVSYLNDVALTSM